MAATKAIATLQASGSSAAGATTNSASVNLTTAYGAGLTAQVTNGATAPTTACVATVQVSPDNATWYDYAAGSAGLTNAGIYPFSWELGIGWLYARVRFSGHTGQAVTVAAQAQYTTGI